MLGILVAYIPELGNARERVLAAAAAWCCRTTRPGVLAILATGSTAMGRARR